ncbi:MAG: hypothetical protein ABSF71_28195 [Terriglobia bacterium]|jgi:hypothetical protein
MSIKTLSSREVYRNPWLRVRENRDERGNGAIGIYGVVDKDNCAIVILLDGERENPWTSKSRPRHACLGLYGPNRYNLWS